MPFDVAPYVDPATTAVVALEVQEGLLDPDKSFLPGLAKSAEDGKLVPRLAELYSTARRVGVQMFYVLDQRRHDGLGGVSNLMMGHVTKGGRDRFVHERRSPPLHPSPRTSWSHVSMA